MNAQVRRGKSRTNLESCTCSVCKNCNFSSESEQGLCTACESGIHKMRQ